MTAKNARPKLKGTMMDKLRRAFSAKDEAGFEEAMSAVEEAAEATEEQASQAELVDMIGQAVAAAVAPAVVEALAPMTGRLDEVDAYMTDRKVKDAEAATAEEARKKAEAEATPVTDSTKDNDALAAFLKAKGMSDEDVAEACTMLKAAEPKPTTDDIGGDVPPGTDTKTIGRGDGATTDSASLLATFRDTVAKAEILAPGVKLPSFDAKAKLVSTNDAMCALRRRALKDAFDSADRKAHVVPFLDTATPDFTKMTCDAVKHVFAGASTLASRANVPTLRTSDALPAFDRGVVRDSVSAMQGAADDLWKHAK